MSLKTPHLLIMLFLSAFIHDAAGQCSCPDSIRTNYRYAAAQSVLQTAIRTHDKQVLDSALIPRDSVRKVLDGLCAIYKSSGGGRDSVFSYANDFKFSFFPWGRNLREITISGDSSLAELKNLYAGKPSGNTRLDDLMAKYGFKVTLNRFRKLFTGTFKTDSLINPQKICALIEAAVTGISCAESTVAGDGNSWYTYRLGDTTIYSFTYGWGDCPAGCIHKRTWYYHYYGNCSISKPIYAKPPPVRPVAPLYIYKTPNPDIAFCKNGIPAYQYSRRTIPDYAWELGGQYGTWYLNGRSFRDSDIIFSDSFGTFVLKHIPANPNGVYVTDTVHITRDTAIFISNDFLTTDSATICPGEPININRHLRWEARYEIAVGNASLHTPDTLLNPQYKPIRSVLRFKNGKCIFVDSIHMRRSVFTDSTGLPDSVVLYHGESYQFSASRRWDSLLWDFGDGNLGYGHSPSWKCWNSGGVSITYFFTVYLNNSDGCEFVVRIPVTCHPYPRPNSRKDLKAGTSIQVYPNPATSALFADVPPQTVYTITDFTGKTLLTGHYQSGINTQSLLTGIYTIRFSDQRGMAVFQVLRP